ncbi:MAG: NADH-quinone oxidoreductase subunit M [Baekduia sp.]
MSVALSIPLWLPLAAALAGGVLPRVLHRATVLGAMALVLGWAGGVLWRFDPSAGDEHGLQKVTDETWIGAIGAHYKLGIDGLSIALIAMAALLFLLCLVWALMKEWPNERRFLILFAAAETFVLGALMAQDLLLFIAFFDLMLLPFLLLVFGWGEGPDRAGAMIKLFIYTLVGSLLMLAAAAALAIYADAGPGGSVSFVLSDLEQSPVGASSQEWIFLCFAAAFLIKMPAFPFHGWMPDGYRAMPLPVLAVFSAVLSKVAAYAFLRIVLPVLPDAADTFQALMIGVALCSILYGSLMAFTVTNTRLILGYSSVAQLGFILLGVFALSADGAQGALLQAVNHGLVVAPAFLIVALLGARAGGSEDLRDLGGIAFRAPVLAALFLIVALATLAMPGSSNFVGEFLILLGAFQESVAVAAIASVGVVLAAVYALRLFIGAMHNRQSGAASRDLDASEATPLVAMVLVIVALALVPQFLLERSERATATVGARPPVPPATAVAGGPEPIATPDHDGGRLGEEESP